MMITSTPIELALSLLAGLAAGGLFFGGLWHTLRKLPSARRPGVLVVTSFIIRAAAALGVFFLVGRGHIDRMLVCLAGFILARFIVMRATRERACDAARATSTTEGGRR